MLNPLGLICRPLTARPETVAALIRAKDQAEARAYAATQLLDELVTAVGTAPMSHMHTAQELDILAMEAHASATGTVAIQERHVTWGPLTRTLADARAFLGRVR